VDEAVSLRQGVLVLVLGVDADISGICLEIHMPQGTKSGATKEYITSGVILLFNSLPLLPSLLSKFDFLPAIETLT
jgi:hypothetical protein